MLTGIGMLVAGLITLLVSKGSPDMLSMGALLLILGLSTLLIGGRTPDRRD